MSRDIRSYFQTKKVQKSIVIEDDDDVIPESPDVHIKNKKKESRKKRCLSDSDEEIFASKKTKSSHESKKTSKTTNKNKTPDKTALKEVKALDMFGSAPIKRTEPLVKKAKKKITETGIHSDEEFEKSLLEVDAIEELASKEIKYDNSPTKNNDKGFNIAKVDVQKEKSLKTNGDIIPIVSKTNKYSNSESNNLQTKNELEASAVENGKTSSKKDRKKAISDVFGNKIEKKRDFSDFIEIKTDNDIQKDKNHKHRKLNNSCNETESKRSEKDESVSKEDKKRNFGEFTDRNESFTDGHDEGSHKNKKKKLNNSLNESVLTDEERHERKMHSAALYQKYLNRSGPKHLGAKEIPKGSPDCLKDCAFLLTGVLDSFEREDITEAITKYGGCIKNSMSKKVTHVLAGDDAGPAKMAKAQELGIKIINESEFLQLIIDLSKKNTSKTVESTKELKKETSTRKTDKRSPRDKKRESFHERKKSEEKITDSKSKSNTEINFKNHETKSKTPSKDNHKIKTELSEKEIKEKLKLIEPMDFLVADLKTQSHANSSSNQAMLNTLMWVERYKPQNIKQIIGQHGEASNVKKLMNWLTKWYVNRKAKLPKPSPWAKNDDGGYYKAALLSGPPGVGKTTTVALVCKELGFDTVEFNASDTRNKSLIKEQIGELLTTTSLSGYAKGSTGKQAVTKKHVLVMDEVDGMSGNEDRGGMQELIALIKSSSVPIICMCNDRNAQKMRSLVNYCFDLRFNRPRVEQIKAAMLSICCKEGIKIPLDALTQLIVSANQDVRQTLNLLSMWAVDSNLTDSERLKKDAKNAKKDVKLGPWEAIRKVFSAEEHKGMSINDMSDLFFYDYSLAPLFVQENYLMVAPHCPKHEVLERMSKAADSISAGDLVDARIRRQQAWSLLPTQAMYSSVIPGHTLAGHVAGQVQFPGWLGKNSRATKMHRLCQEIHAHTRLSTSGSKSSIFLDYCGHLRDAVVAPLLKDRGEGISKALEVLESYHLLREDLDSLTELSLWPGQRNPMILIDSKVKAAMTRTYNKTAMALPYAPGGVRRARAAGDAGAGADGEDEEDVDDEQDSDVENDALIKKRKVKEEKPSASKEKPSSSKHKPTSGKGKKK